MASGIDETESPREGQEHIAEFPEAPEGVAGHSVSSSGKTSINVSNAHGYLCHISTEGRYDCPPALIYALFTNPGEDTLCQANTWKMGILLGASFEGASGQH